MTAHTPAHFTPGQVLDAGHRAESEGRHDFALQLYRHLATQHPNAPEAAAAHEGMARLAPAPLMIEPDYPPMGYPQAAVQAPVPLSGTGYAPPPQRRPISIAPLDRAGDQPPFVPPKPCRDYLAGRFLAKAVAWVGGLHVLVGLGVVPVSLLVPEALAVLPDGGRLVGGPVIGAGLFGGGLLMMLFGQLVRALLEQANATRDLAAMTRARAEHDAASHAGDRHVRH